MCPLCRAQTSVCSGKCSLSLISRVEDRPRQGASGVPGPQAGECPLKTLRPGPRRPAWCHPERGPGWLGPKALPSLPSRARATEEALMAKEAPRGCCSWRGVGLAGPRRGSSMFPAAPRPPPGPRAQRLSSCGQCGCPVHPCPQELLCSNNSDQGPHTPRRKNHGPSFPGRRQRAPHPPSSPTVSLPWPDFFRDTVPPTYTAGRIGAPGPAPPPRLFPTGLPVNLFFGVPSLPSLILCSLCPEASARACLLHGAFWDCSRPSYTLTGLNL